MNRPDLNNSVDDIAVFRNLVVLSERASGRFAFENIVFFSAAYVVWFGQRCTLNKKVDKINVDAREL